MAAALELQLCFQGAYLALELLHFIGSLQGSKGNGKDDAGYQSPLYSEVEEAHKLRVCRLSWFFEQQAVAFGGPDCAAYS